MLNSWFLQTGRRGDICRELVADITGTLSSRCTPSVDVVEDSFEGNKRISARRRAPALGCRDSNGKIFSSNTTSREI
jgi:hypothetical protein